jgi:aminoglycoside 6-adenylyltransferase
MMKICCGIYDGKVMPTAEGLENRLRDTSRKRMADEAFTQLPYAMWMYNHVVRDMLNYMVEWRIGMFTDFSVTAGKCGKYFKRYLPTELYAQYAATYSGSDSNDIWSAVYTMCDLFHALALSVAEHFSFTYHQNEENGLREYLRIVRERVVWRT